MKKSIKFNDKIFDVTFYHLMDLTEAKNEDKRGFYLWQFWGRITYNGYSIKLSDTPSGCGPIQLYQYERITNEFIEIIKFLIDQAINAKEIFPNYANSFQFIHGNLQSPAQKLLESIGFEIKTYKNIRHMGTGDMQSFCYLDLVKIYENKKK